MAIALDTSTSSGNIVSASSITLSHTCTGSNLILFVGVTGGGSDTVTGVTYNSVSMTQVGKIQVPSDRWQYLYYLINPSTGANNIVVSASGAISDWACGGVSYTGAKQSGQPDASNTGTVSASNDITTSVTTVANNCWLVGWCGAGSSVLSVNSGTTQRQFINSGEFVILGDSNGLKSPAGSYSLSWHNTSSANMGAIVASIAPDAVVYTLTADTVAFTLTGNTVNLNRGLLMTASTGAFTFTGTTTNFSLGSNLLVSVGSFALTGNNATLNYAGWANQSKNSTTFTNVTKNSSTFTNISKNSSTWTNQTK